MHRASRESGGARWPAVAAVVVVLAVAGAAAWFFFLRGDGGILGRETPDFSFRLAKTKGKGTEGKVNQSGLTEAAEEVHEVMNGVYRAGFVDPALWQNGTFPQVIEAFGEPAAARAQVDLSDLTLGEASSEIEFVQPGRGRLDVSLLFEGTEPFSAVATAAFTATGELSSGGTVGITHGGRYILRRLDGAWRIVGYEVSGELEEVHAGASP